MSIKEKIVFQRTMYEYIPIYTDRYIQHLEDISKERIYYANLNNVYEAKMAILGREKLIFRNKNNLEFIRYLESQL
ncbi:MAG: hypothetical protein GY756_03820 [bacterium]|nr:hypothetical protein [bacterium]